MTASLQSRSSVQSSDELVSLGYVVLGGFNESQIEEWASSNNISDQVVEIKIQGPACNGKPRFEIKVPESVLTDPKVSRPPQLPAC